MLMHSNGFVRSGRVWIRHEETEFAYSDGEEIEDYLRTVVEHASDLTSFSPELEDAIEDWATEYHLSSKRANLFRAFDLRRYESVLELGCGCGAITRFLGESGLQVDAVEGSSSRARIAAERCRDLDNVNVYTSNFNDLKLPEKSYDLICLVGVVEYAARFSYSDDEEPAVALLRRVRSALKPGGVVLVAIENRTGLKYVMGAHEDHYARRFIGVNNYFGRKDINTYTRNEWRAIGEKIGARKTRMFYPFPDYKVPTIVLSEDFTDGNPNAFCNLEGMESRDYIDVFAPEVPETLLWQSIAAADTLGEYANSFLMAFSFDLLAEFDEFDIDFAHLPSFRRRREFCVVTVKPKGKPVVERNRIVPGNPASGTNRCVTHRVLDEPYHEGVLLSVMWSRALEIEPETDRFLALVRDYYSYLMEKADISIDLIPVNIVVDNNGDYHAFDEEWVSSTKVSPRFVLFRALIMLVVHSGRALSDFARFKNLGTVQDFVIHVGDAAGVDLARHLEEYVDQEESFQNAIAESRKADGTRELLDRSIAETTRSAAPVKFRLYWTSGGEAYSEERLRYALVDCGDDKQVITMRVPAAARIPRKFRFNPAESLRQDGIGFMRIYRMEVFAVDPASGDRSSVWCLSDGREIRDYTEMKGIEYAESGLGAVFMITEEDPALEFEFVPRVAMTGREYLEFEFEFRMPRSRDYLLAMDRYILNTELLITKQRVIDEALTSYRYVEDELRDIKSSDFWRLFVRYRNVRKRSQWLVEKFGMWRVMLDNLGYVGTTKRALHSLEKRANGVLRRKPRIEGPPTRYEIWRDRSLRRDVDWSGDGPLISVVMPVYNSGKEVLERAVDSVVRQTYENWELCIADDASDDPDTVNALSRITDKRIKIRRLPANLNISGATNAAAENAVGEYLAFMDNDDELMETALQEVAAAVVRTESDFVYTDEDFIRLDKHLDNPHFKSDYNPDLLLSHNYITHLFVLKRDLFDEIGGFRTEYDGAQDYDLILRAVETAEKIHHIARPLYHWRMSEKSTSLNPAVKPQGHGNAKAALVDALYRRGIQGHVEETKLPHYFRVCRAVTDTPKVSIVVPFRDKTGLLAGCVRSLLEKTEYSNYEVIGISNDSFSPNTYDTMEELKKLDSRVTFREYNDSYNVSKIINYGIGESNGNHIVLMNSDIEIINGDWIEGLLEHSQREEVAAVGGKLYYPNNRIQHAGIAICKGGFDAHMHKNFRADSPGYFNRLNVIQNVTAVSGALMMVEKWKYWKMNGFDEANFDVSFNDIDFCLRAREHGYLNVFTPYVAAYHHESDLSRGHKNLAGGVKRALRAKEKLMDIHRKVVESPDPYYSPNFNQRREDFTYTG